MQYQIYDREHDKWIDAKILQATVDIGEKHSIDVYGDNLRLKPGIPPEKPNHKYQSAHNPCILCGRRDNDDVIEKLFACWFMIGCIATILFIIALIKYVVT